MVHLEKSRSVLNDFQIALVSVAAVLIILVNGLLCVFLVRDSRLWQLVRFDCLGGKLFHCCCCCGNHALSFTVVQLMLINAFCSASEQNDVFVGFG